MLKTFKLHTTETITRTALILIVLFLAFYGFTTGSDHFLRITILLGLLCGYLRFNENQRQSWILHLIVATLLPFLFILSIAYFKQMHLSYQPLLLWPGISATAFGVGLIIRHLKTDQLYKRSFITGIILVFVFASTRKYGEGWFAMITTLSFVVASLNVSSLKPSKPFAAFAILIATPLIIILIFSDMSGIIITMPVLLTAALLSYLNFRQAANPVGNSFKRYLPFVIFILASPLIWLLQENYAMWHYCSSNISPLKEVSVNIPDQRKDSIPVNHPQTKVYLFWSASCSMCKKEFPYFSSLAAKYKNRDDVKFYAVFLEFDKTDSIVFNREIRQDHDFDWAFLPDGMVLYDNLLMNGVPHITIIDNNNKILYNGRVSNRPWLFVNRPEAFISRTEINL